MRRRKEKGFTLIELIVVVAILGVLAGVGVPRVMGALESARVNTNLANRSLVQSAVERYFVENSAYPTDAGTGSDTLAAGTLPPAGFVRSLSAATGVPTIGAFANYFSGGTLPRLRPSAMAGAGNGTLTNAANPITASHFWGIDSNGRVVVISAPGADTAIIWVP